MQIDAEAKKLAEQFLAEQGAKLDEKAADVCQPSTNILIGIPCFGGLIQQRTVSLLLGLTGCLSKAGIPHQTHFVSGESLIMRARNYLASVATFSHDDAGRPFSHLMFIDADISFHPEYFFKMLKANLPIVALPYSLKKLDWGCIAKASKQVTPESLPFFGGSPVIVSDSGFSIDDKPVRVHAAGTGAMLISVEVFKALAAAHPERKYRSRSSYSPRPQPQPDWNYDFLRLKIINEELLGEDYAFCEESARLGFGTFLLPMAVTRHTGSFDYTMDMTAVASIDACATPVARER